MRMASCADCDSSKTCKGDHGAYDDVSKKYSASITTDCGNTYSSFSQFEHSVQPEIVHGEPYNVIDTDYKYYFINNWFSSVPSPLLDTWNCYYDVTYDCYPGDVDFEIRHPQGYTDSDFTFERPQPDASESDGYEGIMNAALAVIGGVSGSALVSAGAAAMGSFINTSALNPVQFNGGTVSNNPNRQRWTWSINLDGSNESEFPDAPCDSTAVRFRINPNYSGQTGKVHSWSRQTFMIAEYGTDQCHCDKNVYHYAHTTGWAFRDFQFDVR